MMAPVPAQYSNPPLWSFSGLSIGEITGRVIFGALTVGSVALIMICMMLAVERVNEPFAGFLLAERLVVGNEGLYHWTGMQAGLKYPDQVLKVDGQDLRSIRQFDDLVNSKPIGSKIKYTIDNGEKIYDVEIPTMMHTWSDLWMTFGLFFISGLIYIAIGAIVFVLKPNTEVSWGFMAMCFFLGLYAPTSYYFKYDILDRINLLVNTFFPAALLHLSLVFPEKRAVVTKHPSLKLLPYVLSALLLVPVELLFPRPAFKPFYNAVYLYMLIAAITFTALTLTSFFKGTSVIARQRAKVILFGAAVAFPLPAVALLAGITGKTLGGVQIQTNFLGLPILLFPTSVAFAIAKHNLFDVDVYIRRTVGYAIMTLIVGAGYFSVQVFLRKFVLDPLFGAQAENVYPLVFALLVVFFFNPINRKVQENVDKLFFRKQYDYKAAVAKVTDALSMTIDVNDIIHRTVGVLRKEMFVDNAGVVLLDDRKRECRSLFIMDGQVKGQEESKDLCLDYEDPLLALLAKEKKLITKYDVAEDPQYVAVRESCGQRFAAMGASVAVPLFSHDQVTGVLALGYKKSGHFYNREDIDLLKTVSSMTSTAIEQVREKGEKQMVMQLFSKHVSSEVAEAVWSEREQFLEGGRPKSQKLMVTVLFTDLKGFSTLSEKTDPQGLMDLLNVYMDTMAKCVMDHEGVVDDYFGDGMKANFGVPIPRTTEDEIRKDALNAVNCALAMEQEMIRLNSRMQEQNLPTLKMRVGIYTGYAVAGSLGSSERMKYTTVGDTVNTAARLESFDKDLALPHLETSPCRIIMGESTLNYLGAQFETLSVGDLSLKGKGEKIKAYCIVSRRLATVPPA